MKLAGVVVLFHPTDDMFQNIFTYIDDLDILYAVDNSDVKNERFISKLKQYKKVRYLDNQGNKGMGIALNRAAHNAICKDYKWLFTIDQDSRASENMMKDMMKFIQESNQESLGIATPYPLNKYERRPVHGRMKQLEVMTSGNFLNLEAYALVGGFENKYIVDFTDYEFCMKLSINKFNVLMNYDTFLYHNLGDMQRKDSQYILNRSPVRVYYNVRNRLDMLRKYKNNYQSWYKENVLNLLQAMILEILNGNRKLKKLRYAIKGYIDYKAGNFGKYEDRWRR